ncbi:PREDICTED: uncharacterized protein LOC106910207 [Poecilia mexicana]|uniref:uncharacterized protein LOC106910207 n=1 Tax=Poecilia mexicana TaxID=48701 RepID=UPI00072E2874|nr:PREDICTED: uncharacterized protein LOC106910207 [Poecilia mexicana]
MSEEDRLQDVLLEDVDEGFDEVTEAFLDTSFQKTSAPQKPPLSDSYFNDSYFELVRDTASDEGETVGPDGAPGYQHVVRLARRLVDLEMKGKLCDEEVEHILQLWQNLSEKDKQPSCNKAAPSTGSTSSRATRTENISSLSPDSSRLVETIFRELSTLYGSDKRIMGVVINRWSLVLRHYNAIRNMVVNHPILKTKTTLNLFAINQVAISQWHKRLMAREDISTPLLTSGESFTVAQEPQLDPGSSSVVWNLLVTTGEPKEALSQTSPAPAPSTSTSMVGAAVLPALINISTRTPTPIAPKRKMDQQQVEVPPTTTCIPEQRAVSFRCCTSCGKRRIWDTGHRVLRAANGKRLSYCPVAANGKGPEEWLASL